MTEIPEPVGRVRILTFCCVALENALASFREPQSGSQGGLTPRERHFARDYRLCVRGCRDSSPTTFLPREKHGQTALRCGDIDREDIALKVGTASIAAELLCRWVMLIQKVDD